MPFPKNGGAWAGSSMFCLLGSPILCTKAKILRASLCSSVVWYYLVFVLAQAAVTFPELKRSHFNGAQLTTIVHVCFTFCGQTEMNHQQSQCWQLTIHIFSFVILLDVFWTRHAPSQSNCGLPFCDALGRRRGCPRSLKQCLRRQCATNWALARPGVLNSSPVLLPCFQDSTHQVIMRKLFHVAIRFKTPQFFWLAFAQLGTSFLALQPGKENTSFRTSHFPNAGKGIAAELLLLLFTSPDAGHGLPSCLFVWPRSIG